jgi:hypothetical protein
MAHEKNPQVDPKKTRPGEDVRPPNPAEDISGYGREEEPVVFGPDGSGEAPETDSDEQYGRGAD